MSEENGDKTLKIIQGVVSSIITSLVTVSDNIHLLRSRHTSDCSVHRSASYNEYVDDNWDKIQDDINMLWASVSDLEYILEKIKADS